MIPVTPGQCLTCPTTTATAFMFRGYRRVNAVPKHFKTRSVGPSLPILPFYADTPLVRGNALGFVGFPESPSRRPTSFVSAINSHWLNGSPSDSPLRVITEIGGTFSTAHRESSVETDQQGTPSRQDSTSTTILSPTRYDSPVPGVLCDGWCGYDLIPRATVVSAICAWCTITINDISLFRLGVFVRMRGSSACMGRPTGFAHRCAMPISKSVPLPRIWPFICYGPVIDHIDDRNKPLPIIPHSDGPCQVRHNPRFKPTFDPYRRLFDRTFYPFLVSSSIRIAVSCTNIPLPRRRKRRKAKGRASTGN